MPNQKKYKNTTYSFSMSGNEKINIDLSKILKINYNKLKINSKHDFKSFISNLGELSVQCDLSKYKFYIYPQAANGKNPVDLVLQDATYGVMGKYFGVSVKSTGSKKHPNAYPIYISRNRTNMKTNKKYPFKKEECHLLAIYILEKLTVIYIDPKVVDNCSYINIYDDIDKFNKAKINPKVTNPIFYMYDHLSPLPILYKKWYKNKARK